MKCETPSFPHCGSGVSSKFLVCMNSVTGRHCRTRHQPELRHLTSGKKETEVERIRLHRFLSTCGSAQSKHVCVERSCFALPCHVSADQAALTWLRCDTDLFRHTGDMCQHHSIMWSQYTPMSRRARMHAGLCVGLPWPAEFWEISEKPGGYRRDWGTRCCGASTCSRVGMTALSGSPINQPEGLEAFRSQEPECWVKLAVPLILQQELWSQICQSTSVNSQPSVSISWSLEKLDLPMCSCRFPLASEGSGFLWFFFFFRKASCYSFSKVVGKQDFRFCNSQQQRRTHHINTHARLRNTK